MLFFNNEFVDPASVSISYNDRGYVFGDGIYEVIRVYHGRPYYLQEHLDRLVRSANEIRLPPTYSKQQWIELLTRLIELNKLEDGYIYLQITRGEAVRNHAFPPQPKPTILAYCSVFERPLDKQTTGIAAITVPDIRWLRCDIKSLNLLPNTLAKQEAAERGADEAIFHRDGIVTEASASNLFTVKNGRLFTHPADHLILPGITKIVVQKLADRLKLPLIEELFTLDDLYQADEVFISSTTMEITPVIDIDGKMVGNGQPGSVTGRLQQAFESTLGE